MKLLNVTGFLVSLFIISQGQIACAGWKDILVQVWDNPKEAAKYAWSNPSESFTAAKEATAEDWQKTEPNRKAIIANVSSFSASSWDKTCGVSREAWESTAKWCTEHKDILDHPSQFANTAWDKTSGVSKEAWESTAQWCSEHKEVVAVVVVAAATIAVRAMCQGAGGPYADIPNDPSVGPGKAFTAAQKDAFLNANQLRNGGVLRSDLSGQILFMPKQHTSGYTPPNNEAQIDHITPRSTGGENNSANAQVLSRQENLLKSNK